MAFSESQLTTWSHQGAIATSAATYNSIKTCLAGISWNSDVYYDIYLQGSYKNDTNIYGNSDVDIVVEFTSTFYSNKNEFSATELSEYNSYFNDAKYSLSDFRQAVVEGLQKYYGVANVIEGNKAIRVKGGNGRLDADVICCATYRMYRSFSKVNPHAYNEGITFWEKNTGKQVINFPKQHYNNGVSKHQTSGNNYKPSVRIVKNMRSSMINNGLIASNLAPSYFVECLLYNVNTTTFNKSTLVEMTRFVLIELGSAVTAGGLNSYVCQNGIVPLFGTSERQWSTADAQTFITNLMQFWNAG